MNRLLRKSTLVSIFTAGLVVLLSACGGGGSSSGGGGAATGAGATTMVRGHVSGVGGAQAVFIQEMPGFSVERVAKLITDSVISSAHAVHDADPFADGTNDVLVCITVEGFDPFCDTTHDGGEFSIELAGVPEGTYDITFTTLDGVTYTGRISVVVNATVVAEVTIDPVENEIAIDVISTETVDGPITAEPETAGNSDNVLVTICHKPGTSAQKTKTLPEPAIPGHVGHGDTLGACSA